MLEHQFIVLNGVSDNKYLFRKELKKSLSWLEPGEKRKLKTWVYENYQHKHAEIIKEVFYEDYDLAS